MSKTIRSILILGVIFLMLTPAGSAWSADTFSYNWWKVSFETPMAFSGPSEIGLDAVALASPPDSEPGRGRLEITLVAVPKVMQEAMGNNDGDILAYVKSTFLGTAKPAESTVERSFLGQTIKGEAQKLTIPRPGALEVFLITLSDGDKAAVGLSRSSETPPEEAEAVMEMMARTLKEIPAQ